MTEKIDCAVIGGGVVGLAVARKLAMSGREVVVLEAEEHFGTHTSSRNSEVMHAGIYYPTGSLKAKLCFEGRNALYRYCAEHAVNHKRIGKVIVACDQTELAGLDKYRRQAEINGCDDLRMLSGDELHEMEPEVRAVAGFLSPSTGIIDAHGLMLAYQGDLEAHGGMIALASPVTSGRVTSDGIVLEVGGAEPMSLLCNTVVNSAGFNAQAVSRNVDGVPPASIPPTYYAIGHYYTLSGKAPFNRLVYPVARQDWLGVHVTIDLGGQVKFGPDFAWIDRVDYRFDDSPGHEAAFYKAIRRYYPGLKDGALQPGYTGIRPKIHGPREPAPDFLIQGPRDHGVPGMVNLYGIESPGLTSSLAIGEYVSELLKPA
jgi:L-2-hydroxyglutarate oxidase LhgO